MTTPSAIDVVRRRPKPKSVLGVFLEAARARAERVGAITWPSTRYQNDPCAFAEEVLGMTLWAKQREILDAIRDNTRVSVRSGHKVSKSCTAAIAALWFFCSFEEARVVMSAPTARQVDQILWRELGMLRTRAKLAIEPQLELPKRASTGLHTLDFREIFGFTARQKEAAAGVSGKNILYLLDESSGIEQDFFEAIRGNSAGGARLALFSNPTRTEGEFYESQTSKAIRVVDGVATGFYRAIHVSSEETPNAVSGRIEIPGLATRAWVEEMRAEYGEDSPLFKIRVKGDFVLNEEGRILSVHAITSAEQRWEDTRAEGRLHLGLDPAGPGLAGDESGFALRRGKKVLSVVGMRGLTEEAHVAHVLGFLAAERRVSDPPPVVAIDREGPIGSRIYGLLRAFLDDERNKDAFVLLGVRSSERARREPTIYDRVRDELWANVARFIREGGAIPTDAKLAKELHAPEWIGNLVGRLKATPKEELRKVLERSPDRADAVTLSVWEPAAWLEDAPRTGAGVVPAFSPEPEQIGRPQIDPYAALDAWRKR